MDLGLKGKIAIITGAGSQVGMGKAIALNLAKEGCDIVINDINVEGIEKTAAEVKALKRRCVPIKVDVSNRDEVDKMVKVALEKFGKIDILVNNAGGNTFSGPLAVAKETDLDKEINLNLYEVFNCTKAVLPSMIVRKYGKIASISSDAGRSGVPGSSAYSAAKAGVIGMTKAVAKETGPSNINVNGIAPNLVLTNFYGGEGMPMMPPQKLEVSRTTTPMQRIATVQDIANVVAFLVSDISCNITGQTISVDGGWFMI